VGNILIEKNVLVPMRDGVRLATDVYRDPDAGPQPVLLMRTPYDKDGGSDLDLLRFVQAGYAVVTQDCRGRNASEGAFNPMFQERADGADAVAWAARQPWSSGKVGGFGGSYLGNTQWLAAAEAPPELLALAPTVTWSDFYAGMQYEGGANYMHGLWWSLGMVEEEVRRRMASGQAVPEGMPQGDPTDHLPLSDLPALRELAPHYFEWLAHPTADAYWHGASPNASYERIGAPALNIGGWYDIFLWGTLQNYLGMRQRGGSETARTHQRLLIGPWTHGNFSGSFPDREFGMAASTEAIDLSGVHLRWFDRWLKDVPDGAEADKPVKLFVMGLDQWREEDAWPLPDTRYTPYYLHSGGRANSLRGDGLLALAAPEEQPADVVLYNPHRPAPTVGGQVLIMGVNASGPRDQRSVEERDDVLCYTTPPLERAVEVTGPIELVLHASSSARDTDFTGKLVDVHPDGRAIILTEGILRARYRNSLAAPEPLEPGAVYELRLDLWATANVFLPGHRIRLEVSSSNFPRFARNSNSGGVIADEGPEAYIPTINRVFHDRARPSHLILPIIERQ
jgi:putative CocE/NonD family hydrolase